MAPSSSSDLIPMLLLFCVIGSVADETLSFTATPTLSSGYDYIIVGGGTAGCPLAATLSQRYKVLLLERGGSPYGDPNVLRIESFTTTLYNQSSNSPAQTFTSTEGIVNNRGRVLGGSSSINAGFYSRAELEVLRMLGLDERLANASYDWVERVLVTVPSLGPYQAGFYASLLEAGVTPSNGVTFDHILGTKLGSSTFDNEGNRRPVSDLLRAYGNRANLEVVLHATVQRVIFQGRRAAGVSYTDQTGSSKSVYLNTDRSSEIILSAGALGSPQLLMLSGVGPRQHLESMGLDVVAELEDVGRHVADNPSTRTFISSPSPVETSLVEVVGITSGNYMEASSGPPNVYVGYPDNIVVVSQKVASPRSTGRLLLQTLNADDNPLVSFNYYEYQEDVEACVDGVNYLEEVILASSFTPFRYERQRLPSGGTVAAPNRRNPSFAASLNSTIAEYCRRDIVTMWHNHGGCVVGKVVDPSFRVFGVEGLRVVDISVFNTTPGTNPQATVMMLGRYTAVQIMLVRV